MKYIILLLAIILSLGFSSISYSNTSDKGVKEFESGNNFYKNKDYKQALYWYQKSAEQGNDDAQYRLGFMYFNGRGTAKDHKKGILWFKESAKQGNVGAQYNLGQMYKVGRGIIKDYKQAFYWYKKAAEQGDALGQYSLSMMYFNGEGVTKDLKQSAYWFRKSAEQGNADAQYNLGQMYKNGIGVIKDDLQAFYWFKKHAEQENDSAESKISIKEVIILKMLEDNNCKEVTSNNFHAKLNVHNTVQGTADFECFNVLVPKGYFGVTTVRPISGSVNPDIRVFDMRTKQQVAIGEGDSEELESFNHKGNKRWYRVIIYDFTANKGRHDFYIHTVNQREYFDWVLEENAKSGMDNAKKFLTITAVLVGSYFAAKAIGSVFSPSGDGCLKSSCTPAEKIQHRKFINYVGNKLSRKSNKKQGEICTFIDSLKSFLHAAGFTLSSAVNIGVGLIRASNDGDFASISEDTTDIFFKTSELVEELRYDDRCG